MNEHKIAGDKTSTDWLDLRKRLESESTELLWQQAFKDFFLERLQTRYLSPIQTLQENKKLAGEGFSIMTIICSLIEFLESTYQGKLYKFRDPSENEYSSSKDVFINFLAERKPFSKEFNRDLAQDFYENVRCALLHQASTTGDWKIRAGNRDESLIDASQKIVFRDNFKTGIEHFIVNFGKELEATKERQEAFIRKFNSL